MIPGIERSKHRKPLILWAIPVFVGLGLTISFYFLLAPNFGPYSIGLDTSESNAFLDEDIWFADLDFDSEMERIEIYPQSYEDLRIVLIKNDFVEWQWNIPQSWLPSNDMMIADVDRDSLCEMFLFTQDADTVYGYCFPHFSTGKEPIIFYKQAFSCSIDQSDLHVSQAKDIQKDFLQNRVQYFLISGKFSHAKGEMIRYDFVDQELIRQTDGSLIPTSLNVYEKESGRKFLYGNFSSLSPIEVSFEQQKSWVLFDTLLNPLFEPQGIRSAGLELQIEIAGIGGTEAIVVLEKNREAGIEPFTLRMLDINGNELQRSSFQNGYSDRAFARNMNQRDPSINKDPNNKKYGFSVRCVRGRLPNEQPDSFFLDPRDGQKYRQLRFGEKVWMGSNLNYEAPGDCWLYPDRDDSRSEVPYGRLYDWETAKRACPPSWHLPTDFEFQQLEIALGMNFYADHTGWRWYGNVGRKMQDLQGWHSDSLSNRSGFAALPGGYYDPGNEVLPFKNRGTHGYYWTSTELNFDLNLFIHNQDQARPFSLISTNGEVSRLNSRFETKRVQKIPAMISGHFILFESDRDEGSEFLYLRFPESELVILRNELRDVIRLPISYESDHAAISISESSPKGEKLLVHSGRFSYFFKFEKSRDWILNALFLLLLFMGIVGVFRYILFIQSRAIHRRQKLVGEMTGMQMESIANQFNPHFTFNLLSTVAGFVQEKQPDEANYLISKYAKILRSALILSGKFRIPLRTELETITDYLEIEKTRLENGFEYEIGVPEELLDFEIPKSFLFGFVKNGMKHGTRLLQSNGRIIVRANKVGNRVVLEVLNNGYAPHNGNCDPLISTGSGLKMARKIAEINELIGGGEIEFDLHLNASPNPMDYTLARIVFKN